MFVFAFAHCSRKALEINRIAQSVKLRTITDSVRHSTSTVRFASRAMGAEAAGDGVQRSQGILFFQINVLTARPHVVDLNRHRGACEWPPRLRPVIAVAPGQVPVRAVSLRAGKACCAMARFTAENIASSEAVMILGCIPA